MGVLKVQDALQADELKFGQARALLQLRPEFQEKALEEIRGVGKKKATAKWVEDMVGRLKAKDNRETIPQEPNLPGAWAKLDSFVERPV